MEEFGEEVARKAAILSIAGTYVVIMLYLSIGFSQMFLIELRRKFIAREVEWTGSGYVVRGYFFKHRAFTPDALASVEEYRVEHHYLSSTILTLLCRTPKVNYRVRLKDGHEFYLPGDLDRVEQLRAQLVTDIREHSPNTSTMP